MGKKEIGSGSWADLDNFEIDRGVIKLVEYLNLTGGSIGNMALYKLVRNYLKNEAIRKDINQVLKNHGAI